MSGALHAALLARVEAIAGDVGRLRRRFDSNDAWSGAYLAEQLADNVDALDVMLATPAAELYRDFMVECGDEQVALEEALAAADRRAAHLRRLLERGRA